MSNFINYQGIDFSINNQNFYATQVAISAQASLSPVLLNDGTLLSYAPENAVIGNLACEFYLTGSIPSFLNITGTSEASIAASFAGVSIATLYPKSLSFSVEPFKPILISAEFDWYGPIHVEDFTNQSASAQSAKTAPTYVANGYKSYLNTTNLDGVGHILSFSYSSTSDRPAYFKCGQTEPFRVCKLNKRAAIKLSSNDLGELLEIYGKNVSTTVYLKDLYGESLSSFSVSGVLTSQNYEIQAGQYLLSSADISQQVDEEKTII